MIALMGAPSSGKSRLADELSKSLNAKVVDDYALKVEEEANIVLGVYGTYFGDVGVALARVGAERKLLEDEPEYVVTCGTIVDTITYGSIAESINGVPERTEIVMRFMGLLMWDSFSYDHIFLLPVSDEATTFEQQFYKELCEAIDAFDIAFTRLSENPDERLDEALIKIKGEVDDASKTPEIPDGQGNNGDSAESQGIRDSA